MATDFSDERLRAYFSDPNVLLDDIDAALDSLPVEELPLVGLDPSVKEGYREVSNNRPRHLILEAMLNSKESLADFCCRRGRYCELKVKHGETINLAKALIDTWATLAITFPMPVGTVAAYCVQSLFLDRLCNCPS